MLTALLLLATLAPLSFEISAASLVVPVTLQSLLVILIGIILGPLRGGIVICAYLILGALGVPVFADYKSGIAAFNSASAGFLLGFIPIVMLSGYLPAVFSSRRFVSFIAIFLIAQSVLLIFGAIGLLLYGLAAAPVGNILLSLLPGLVVKSAIGSLIVIAFDRVKQRFAQLHKPTPP